ncbi:MAG: beta-ketoacyl synthase N-terminal-like domain-containing protein [Chthoniobacterales bacterium]
MKTAILGRGWITNHGCEESIVFDAILREAAPPISEIANPFNERIHHVTLVAKENYAEAEGFRRVRRSSMITLLALTAAQRAIAQSCIPWTPEIAARTTLLFASSDGGVVYTRRFYSDVVKSGAGGASPLLFPETVYNAPASHLCAFFGIEGEAMTLVGDAAVSATALQTAAEILESGAADYCLVVGAEELDWILCEAYSTWQQTMDSHTQRTTGAIFAEGAAALLLGRDGPFVCETFEGKTSEKRLAFKNITDSTGITITQIVSSANGTALDAIERAWIEKNYSGIPVHAPKKTLGEALAAGTLQQVVFAQLLMEQNALKPGAGILVSMMGFTGGAGAVILTPSKPQG